MYGYL
jgi:hypothetical protein